MSVVASTAPRAARLRLRPNVRRTLLTVHITAGVGLLGAVAAVLAINIRAATTADAGLAAASYELLAMLTVLFGIPLSLISLASGIVLGLSSAWGVVRHAWVAAKLVLLLGVILVGALVLGPGTDAMRTGDGGAQARLIAGSTYDLVALTLATGLSVFKPRRRRGTAATVRARAPWMLGETSPNCSVALRTVIRTQSPVCTPSRLSGSWTGRRGLLERGALDPAQIKAPLPGWRSTSGSSPSIMMRNRAPQRFTASARTPGPARARAQGPRGCRFRRSCRR